MHTIWASTEEIDAGLDREARLRCKRRRVRGSATMGTDKMALGEVSFAAGPPEAL